MTVQITDQDFYGMRNQRDNERLAGTAKDIEIRQLRQALTEANERIEYANAGPLVTIPRELVFAMEAKMKAQAETIARLEAELAQCKHALDDEGDDK